MCNIATKSDLNKYYYNSFKNMHYTIFIIKINYNIPTQSYLNKSQYFIIKIHYNIPTQSYLNKSNYNNMYGK
jgi:hypothetical protein